MSQLSTDLKEFKAIINEGSGSKDKVLYISKEDAIRIMTAVKKKYSSVMLDGESYKPHHIKLKKIKPEDEVKTNTRWVEDGIHSHIVDEGVEYTVYLFREFEQPPGGDKVLVREYKGYRNKEGKLVMIQGDIPKNER
jgi:hypothetical protein